MVVFSLSNNYCVLKPRNESRKFPKGTAELVRWNVEVERDELKREQSTVGRLEHDSSQTTVMVHKGIGRC